MKTLVLIIVIVIFSSTGFSQTVLHSEDFESGGSGINLNTTDLLGTLTGANPWILNNIYDGGSGFFNCFPFPPIPFVVPGSPTQPAGITNSPTSTYLHVTPQIAIDFGGLLPCASYVTADGICIFGNTSTFTRVSSDFSTVGHDSVTLDLWWMCGGNSIYYGEVYYSIDGGAAWLPVINPLNGTTKWNGQIDWVNSVFTDSNWDGQPTLRFGFRFITANTSLGDELDPGFAIDDIEVRGYPTCAPTASSISPVACHSYISPSGNYTWSTSNTYQDTISNIEGCDSIITVNLTINTVDSSATQIGNSLTANAGGADYQWLDCINGFIAISGATNQTFASISNGDFAVEVTENGCKDTSSCFSITGVGIDEINFGYSINIFPNPAPGNITINTGQINSGEIVIADVLGREILRVKIVSGTTQISLSASQASGTYFVRLLNDDGVILAVEKLVIE